MFVKLWKIRRDGGGGGYSLLQKTENLGRRGVLSEIPSVVEIGIFSGTTHCKECVQVKAAYSLLETKNSKKEVEEAEVKDL